MRTPTDKMTQLQHRRAAVLYERLRQQPDLGLGERLAAWTAIGLAAVVVLSTPLLGGLGLWLIATGLWVPGVLLVVLAIALRPRFNPPPSRPLPRGSHPETLALIDEVAGGVGISAPSAVGVTPEFNAWVYRRGRSTHMEVGMPLVAVLDGQELAALLAHELGHIANRDLFRGGLVGTALQTLMTWWRLLAPRRSAESILEHVSHGILWALAALPYGLLWLLYHLGHPTRLRAEYLADRQAARLAGRDAAASMVAKLGHAGSFEAAARRSGNLGTDPIAALADYAAANPPPPQAAAPADPLASHPPIGLRLGMLEALDDAPPAVIVDAARHAAVAAELEPHRDAMAKAIVSMFRPR